MNRARTCVKCGGRMVRITAEIFGSIFGCTREPKNLEALPRERIQSYYCEHCGYIEFYKEEREYSDPLINAHDARRSTK